MNTGIPWTDPEPDALRQCTAHNRLGDRCKNPPIRGGTVCHMHGGKTPLARKAAKERLLAMVEPAFQVLREALASEDETNAIRAAKIILDRAGFGPQSKVVVVDEREDLKNMTSEELAAKAQAIALELQANAGDVIERQLLEDEKRVH